MSSYGNFHLRLSRAGCLAMFFLALACSSSRMSFDAAQARSAAEAHSEQTVHSSRPAAKWLLTTEYGHVVGLSREPFEVHHVVTLPHPCHQALAPVASPSGEFLAVLIQPIRGGD